MSERLTGLIERLEKAARGSRELDADIYEALDYVVKRNATRTGPKWTRAYAYLDRSRWCAMEHLTTSIDAALALVERVRPGWMWVREHSDGHAYVRLLGPEYARHEYMGSRNRHCTGSVPADRNVALAICLALLRSTEGGERG